MNHYRKANVEYMEAALQARIRRQNLPPEEQVQEKLADLQAFVRDLAKTPHGKADLERRVQMFGACTPEDDESPRHYYGRLRQWLDRACEATRALV